MANKRLKKKLSKNIYLKDTEKAVESALKKGIFKEESKKLNTGKRTRKRAIKEAIKQEERKLKEAKQRIQEEKKKKKEKKKEKERKKKEKKKLKEVEAPSLPKGKGKIADIVKPPKGKEILEDLAKLESDLVAKEYKKKQFLTDMYTSNSVVGDIDTELVDKVKDAIYNADEETIDKILGNLEAMQELEDYYKDNRDRIGNEYSQKERIADLMELLDELGVDY